MGPAAGACAASAPTSPRRGCRSRCAATASPRPTGCSTGSPRNSTAATPRSPGCAGGRRTQERLRAGRHPSPQPTSESRVDDARPPMATDRPRCAWATSAPEYVAYHDDEWGTPLHGERELFERLVARGVPVRAVLADHPAQAARVPHRVRRLRRRRGRRVRRPRRRPAARRSRASCATGPRSRRRSPTRARSATRVPEGLDELLWSFAPAEHVRPRTLADVPVDRRPSRWRWPRS